MLSLERCKGWKTMWEKTGAVQKCANLVELEICCKIITIVLSIHFEKSASIQSRKSPPNLAEIDKFLQFLPIYRYKYNLCGAQERYSGADTGGRLCSPSVKKRSMQGLKVLEAVTATLRRRRQSHLAATPTRSSVC